VKILKNPLNGKVAMLGKDEGKTCSRPWLSVWNSKETKKKRREKGEGAQKRENTQSNSGGDLQKNPKIHSG